MDGRLQVGQLPATLLLVVALLSTVPLGVFAEDPLSGSGESNATNATGMNAVHCYRANSSFVDSSCNCFGQPPARQPRPQTDSVTVVVGGWLGATVDAWMLKLLIEEQLGWPTELIPDTDLFAMENGLGVWGALKSGYAMMYPEVRPRIVANRSVRCTEGIPGSRCAYSKLPRFGIRKKVRCTTSMSSLARRYALFETNVAKKRAEIGSPQSTAPTTWQVQSAGALGVQGQNGAPCGAQERSYFERFTTRVT